MQRNNTVILHIGIHKTGSSSIQSAIYDVRNIRTLPLLGFVIPQSLPRNHSEFIQSAFSDRPDLYHTNISKAPADVLSYVEKLKSSLKQELREIKGQTVVISGEDGCILSQEGFGRLKKFFADALGTDVKFKLVVYTRDPISYVQSAVQENVKGNGLTIDFATNWHIKESANRYKSLFDKCSKVFDEENLHFYSFENQTSFPNSLIKGFFDIIGVASDDLITTHSVNEGINSDIVALLSYFTEKKIELRAKDFSYICSLPGNKYSFLNQAQKNEIIMLSQDDRTYLKEKYHIKYDYTKASVVEPVNKLSQKFVDLLCSCDYEFEPIALKTITDFLEKNR